MNKKNQGLIIAEIDKLNKKNYPCIKLEKSLVLEYKGFKIFAGTDAEGTVWFHLYSCFEVLRVQSKALLHTDSKNLGFLWSPQLVEESSGINEWGLAELVAGLRTYDSLTPLQLKEAQEFYQWARKVYELLDEVREVPIEEAGVIDFGTATESDIEYLEYSLKEESRKKTESRSEKVLDLSKVRSKEIDGEIFYVLKDVYKLLELKDCTEVRRLLNPSEVRIERFPFSLKDRRVFSYRVTTFNELQKVVDYVNDLRTTRKVVLRNSQITTPESKFKLGVFGGLIRETPATTVNCSPPVHHLGYNNVDFQQLMFESTLIKYHEVDGELWFSLKDVCNALLIKDHEKVKQRIDGDYKRIMKFPHPSNPNNLVPTTVVNESGIYDVLLGARPSAIHSSTPEEVQKRKNLIKRFKKWVVEDVLPSIRKTGSYSIHQQLTSTSNFPLTSEHLRQLADALEERNVLKEQNQTLIAENSELKEKLNSIVSIIGGQAFLLEENLSK